MGTVVGQQTVSPSSQPNEAALIEIVERGMHASPSEWLFFRELRVGTGRKNGGAQRLDAFDVNTLPHPAVHPTHSGIETVTVVLQGQLSYQEEGSFLSRAFIRHVKRNRADALAEFIYQVIQSSRVPRCGD